MVRNVGERFLHESVQGDIEGFRQVIEIAIQFQIANNFRVVIAPLYCQLLQAFSQAELVEQGWGAGGAKFGESRFGHRQRSFRWLGRWHEFRLPFGAGAAANRLGFRLDRSQPLAEFIVQFPGKVAPFRFLQAEQLLRKQAILPQQFLRALFRLSDRGNVNADSHQAGSFAVLAEIRGERGGK